MGKNLLAGQGGGRNLLRSDTPVNVNPIAGTARAALQGATFGWSDEIGGALAALAGSFRTGESFDDAYSKIHQQLQDKREKFSKDNPGVALGAEIAGGLATGVLGGAKALGGQAFRQATNAGKIGRTMGVGAAQGGVYGGGAADQGDTLEGAASGAALGAVAAPVVGGALNAAGRGLGATANYVGAKLAESPRSKAERVLRQTAEASGRTGDEIADKYAALNTRNNRVFGERTAKDAALVDVNDSFRTVGRAAMNRQGTARDAGREFVEKRQAAQQERLMEAIESVAGSKSEYGSTFKRKMLELQQQSKPLYDKAFQAGIRTNQKLESLKGAKGKDQPKAILAWAYNKARGQLGPGANELEVWHLAKSEYISDAIGKAVRKGENAKARRLIAQKNDLMDLLTQQNPAYKEATEAYADGISLVNAIKLGREFLKKDVEDLTDLVLGMSKSEKELFQLGAVKALGKMMDKTGTNRDARLKLINSREMKEKLTLVMDDVDTFLKQAGIEDSFTQTRQMLTGNSTTELQQQASRSLDDAVDPGPMQAIVNANPQALVGKIIEGVSKNNATPEVIDELGKILFNQNLSRQDILRIFNQPRIRQALGDRYEDIIAPLMRSAATPVTVGPASQN
jgi:hypothetical protein